MQKRQWLAGGSALAMLALLAAPAMGTTTSATRGHETAAQLRAEALHNTLLKTHGTLNYCATYHFACDLQVLTTSPGSKTIVTSDAPSGIGATDLEDAYKLTNAPSADGIITIIDAGAFPPKDLEASLAMYRSTYGLPACTLKSGCLTVLDRFGGKAYRAPTNPVHQQRAEQIGVETVLDVDMASAACPGCKIVELQVPSKDGYFGSQKHIHRATRQFGQAVLTAVKMGTSAVSISYGFMPVDSITDGGVIAKQLDQKGTTITVSSGDSGYVGTQGRWPQNLRTVISVGGTSLTKDDSARGWSETAWSGGGSACSPDLGPAIGQPKSVSKNCDNMRASADMSADSAVQIAAYDGYAPFSHQPLGWFIVGGTSAAAPFVGAIAARSPRIPDISGPNVIYADPSKAFFDITTGSNGSTCASQFTAKLCTAGPGWDGPTGVGTPNGLRPFTS